MSAVLEGVGMGVGVGWAGGKETLVFYGMGTGREGRLIEYFY